MSSLYQAEKLDNGWTRLMMTNVLDDIWDEIIIYQKDDQFTDDGYFDFQLEVDAGIDSPNERLRVLKRSAKYFGCHIDETDNSITVTNADHDFALARILQACTAVVTIIRERNRK